MSAVDVSIGVLNSYTKVVNSKYNNNSIKIMREEMDSLTRNQTWTLVPNLENKKGVATNGYSRKKRAF